MADMLERIAKILNQAEHASTEAEAAVFMAAAQRLATMHSIDLAKARHATKSKEKTIPIQRAVTIALPKTQGIRTLTDLYLGIAAANDIKCTIAKNATRVFAYGFAEDIDISEALFASLLVQLQVAVDAYKSDDSWRDEVAWRDGYYSDYHGRYIESGRRKVTWKTARINFQEGFASRIGGRLAQAKREEERRIVQEERVVQTERESTDVLANEFETQEPEPQSAGTELVLASKREQVDEFYTKDTRHLRGSYRGFSGTTARGSRDAGRAAADRANLGRGAEIGGAKKAIGR